MTIAKEQIGQIVALVVIVSASVMISATIFPLIAEQAKNDARNLARGIGTVETKENYESCRGDNYGSSCCKGCGKCEPEKVDDTTVVSEVPFTDTASQDGMII